MGIIWSCNRCHKRREPHGICECGSPGFVVHNAFDVDEIVMCRGQYGKVLAVSGHVNISERLYAVKMANSDIWQVKVEELCHP